MSTKLSALRMTKEANDNPTVFFRGYAPAGPGFARVVFNVINNSAFRKDNSVVLTSISKAMDNKAMPVAGTWSIVGNIHANDCDVVGVVSSVRQVMAYSDTVKNTLRAVSSNIFMDSDDNIWALKHTDSGDMVIRTTAGGDAELLKDLLESMSSTFVATAASRQSWNTAKPVNANISFPLSGGDYVAYVSDKSEQASPMLASGYVVTTVHSGNEDSPATGVVVLNHRDAKEYEMIHPNRVLCAYALAQEEVSDDAKMLAANIGSNTSIEDVLAYYRILYSRRADYYAMLEERIRARFQA